MTKLKTICVFCGASEGDDPCYIEAAREFGKLIAENGTTLVYGGGHIGIMGAIAESALVAGGKVIGIIPEHLQLKEDAFFKITDLEVVPDMHTRKKRMHDLTDAFCTFPGGFGSLDETFEMITWKQLELNNKPIILSNINGYWDDWKKMTDGLIKKRFASPEDANLYTIVDDIHDIIPTIEKELSEGATKKEELKKRTNKIVP